MKTLTLLLTLLITITLTAHSGRTDKYGGHKNRKTGTYHFHNAGKVHHKNNPYQDHKKCGVCKKVVKSKK